MKDLEPGLRALEQAGLYRRRLVREGPQGIKLCISGEHLTSFCSNDYLGLANHPAVIAAAKRAADEFGFGSGAAHLISGHTREHHALEEELADFTGRPRALLFSTGYMANLGVMQALSGRGDTILEDRLNHASLIDGARLSDATLVRYTHNDPTDLDRKLKTARGEKLIASDGLFSMDGDEAAVRALSEIASQHNAWLMIDDAHGLGVSGPTGRGTLESQNCSIDEVPILMGTLGKAFGTFGAFVAGSEALIETLIQYARTWIYTTAPPAAVAAAARAALRLVDAEPWRRQKLADNIRRLRAGADRAGLELMPSESPIQPLLVGNEQTTLDYSRHLRECGFLVTAIRPPTVARNTARLRITVCAEHEEAHINGLLKALESFRPASDITP